MSENFTIRIESKSEVYNNQSRSEVIKTIKGLYKLDRLKPPKDSTIYNALNRESEVVFRLSNKVIRIFNVNQKKTFITVHPVTGKLITMRVTSKYY